MPADASARKTVYALLITVAAATVAGRLLSAELLFEPSVPKSWPATRPRPMPTFSSNDRSRWATIRALVEKGTYAVGQRDRNVVIASAVSLLGTRTGPDTAVLLAAGRFARLQSDHDIIFEDGYKSVDKVMDPETLTFYSSKPPLLSTLLAGEYWLVYQLGWTLQYDPWVVVRVIVFTFQWLPLVIYLVLLARLVDRFGTTAWGRYFVVAAGGFATLVTLFAISVNNHVIGTCSVLFALYPALRIWQQPGPVATSWGGRLARWLGAGSGPGAAANLPARSLFVLSGFFAGFAACNEMPALALTAALFGLLLLKIPGRTLAYFLPAAVVPLAAFVVTNYLAIGQLRPVQSRFGSPWYEYEGSHWQRPQPGEQKSGIDWARLKESRADYAFHVFLGHHGLFSLSPIFLLAVAGMVAGTVRGKQTNEEAVALGKEKEEKPPGVPFVLFPMTLLLTVVVVGFYLVKTDNYGGWTNGLRWLMWLTPLWLLVMVPVADHLGGCRWGRGLAYLLLAVSIISVSYRSWNPWRHPWLYELFEAMGWPGY
jgi:hypothetical protein